MTVCVDWDDTIQVTHFDMGAWGEWIETGYNYEEEIIELLLEYQEEGAEIVILTMRGPNVRYKGVEDYKIEQYVEELKDKYGLNINRVIYTNGQSKHTFLLENNADVFIDDNSENICMAAQYCHKCYIIHVKRYEERNSTLDYFVENGMVEVIKYI